MTMTQSLASRTELLFVSHLMARPDLLPAVSPDPKTINNAAARSMLKVLQINGPAYATPGAMVAALQELPEEIDGNDVEATFLLVPEPEDVELQQLLTLHEQVKSASRVRKLSQRLAGAAELAGAKDTTELVAEVRSLLDTFQREQVGRDHTATGILSRMNAGMSRVRWRSGCEDLDRLFNGVSPDNKPGFGLLAQGEILVLAARYGLGKTRLALNWVVSLLDQGASVALLVLEDDDTSFATRLMAIKSDVPAWRIEQYLVFGAGVFFEHEQEIIDRIEAAKEWWAGIGDRIRVYDGSAQANIFQYKQAIEVLATDVSLHNTTHIFVDYVQSWTGDVQDIESYAFGLRAFAGRHNVGLVEVSQLSNETIKWGSSPGMVAAKGSGAWGAAAHIGIELEDDPSVGQEEIRLNVKKARNAPRAMCYARFNPNTGRVRAYYGTPELMQLPEPPKSGPAKKGARK